MSKITLKKTITEDLLETILIKKYGKTTVTLRELSIATKLPLWFLNELNSLSLNPKEFTMALKVAIFCIKSERFTKSALNQKTKQERERIYNTREYTQFESWIYSYVINNKDKKIHTKTVYLHLLNHFPNLKNDKQFNLEIIRKLIRKFRNKIYNLKK